MQKVTHIEELLDIVVERSGADLHISAGEKPVINVNGNLTRLDQFDPLTPMETQALVYDILSNEQINTFETTRELDFSHEISRERAGKSAGSRFRGSALRDRKTVGAVFRYIPRVIPDLDSLGLPSVFKDSLLKLEKGLILVTGVTGSGKTTSIAAGIDYINKTRAEHIITIEDPMEFLYGNAQSIIRQREVGTDTLAFANALRGALRQAPNIIVVGEMRDLETIKLAVTAAETGHLVFATLHTKSAVESCDRIIDVFPPGQQEQVKVQLGEVLAAVISQQLVPAAKGGTRVLAAEVMLTTPAIKNNIRRGNTSALMNIIQTNKPAGMETMDQSLVALVKAGKITRETALQYSHNRQNIETMLK